jgi:hypothetical protein
MTLWRRFKAGLWSLGRRVRSLFAASTPALPAPVESKGAKDVRSSDLGDKSGWLGRSFVYEVADDIQTAVLTDGMLLRAMHSYENLARQGGVVLEPATGSGVSERKAKRAWREIEEFLAGISTPFGENWEDLFYKSCLSLAVFHNFVAELVWQDRKIVNFDLLPWGSVMQIVTAKGVPVGWIQFDYSYNRIPFALQEIAHGHLNRWPGDRYGTPLLGPVAGEDGDLHALRSIEALAGKQAQMLTFPYTIINFGTEGEPVRNATEQAANTALVEDMVRHGTLIGNGRVRGQVLEPKGKDLDGTLTHWQKRTVVPTGRSLLSLGMPENVNVATAEVIDAQESQNQLAVALAASANWRRSIFAPALYTRGIDPRLAPRLVPGEPNPVRREKSGKHAQGLGNDGYLDRNEVRRANGYQPMTPQQEIMVGQPKEQDSAEAPAEPTEPQDRKENRDGQE